MRATRLPYRTCSTASRLEPWLLVDAGNANPLPELHPAWDPSVDLQVTRNVVFDGRAFGEGTGLADGAKIRLVAGFDCEPARSRQFPWSHDIVLPSGFEGTLRLSIPASQLAAHVDLVVGAVLVVGSREGHALRARVPGSWLWEDRTRLVLDGGRTRFPMEWTDFAKSGLPKDAAWFLDWSSQDWQAPTLGTLRLLLNSKHPALDKVVRLPESDARRRLVIYSARFDIAKQLMMAALSSDEFVAGSEANEEGTVGHSIHLLLRSCFPSESFRTLRERMLHQAGEFHAQLQSGFGAFELGSDA